MGAAQELENRAADSASFSLRAANRAATVSAVRVGRIPEPSHDRVRLPVTVRTRLFGTLRGTVDHLVSLELGGSNSQSNLFPEAATPRPGSHEKDRLENRLHAEVCDGSITLRRAQRLIASDWVTAYRERFG